MKYQGRVSICAVFVILLMLVGTMQLTDPCVNGQNCTLPDCFCAHQSDGNKTRTPGDLDKDETPQIVVFSFDDGVNVQNFDIYNRLFSPKILNPNGCPISMTLFVSLEFTNYSMVHSLYARGIEIASHSVTHRLPIDFWKTISKDDMHFEAFVSKSVLSEVAGIPMSEIRGWRSPYLQVGGDMSFKVLQDLGYEYDASILTLGHSGKTTQQWPFTLDFGYQARCQIPPCPTDSHPGLWEVPLVPVDDRAGMFPCSFLDGCFFPPMTKEHTLDILNKNFYVNYNGTRQPLYINLHASWFFLADYRLEAVEEFIKSILDKQNVFIVGMHQLLQWVRNPTKMEDMCLKFKPWQC